MLSPRSAPSVVAHRGASSELPEHTLPAYQLAIDQGATALECDVRLTSDGHPVCVHDRTVNRTSNGLGLVSTHTLAQLRELDWGSWFEGSSAGQVLTLVELLQLVGDNPGVELAVETKHPLRYGGQLEQVLARTLADFGWLAPAVGRPRPVRVMSFSALALIRMRSLAPSLDLVYLVDRWLPPVWAPLPGGAAILGPNIETVARDPEPVRQRLARGGRVHIWTVDTPEHLELCAELGIEALITNRPAWALGRLTGK
jgi:glycerophosphoryl diester phosphodiesterase